MISWWPFVSKTLFAYQEREILELRRELRDVQHEYRRLLNEVNFRSTGFHLYEEFEKKAVESPASEPAPVDKPEVLSPVEEAIRNVGTRPTAVRQYLEQKNASALRNHEAEFAATAEQRRQQAQFSNIPSEPSNKDAAKITTLLESALKKGEERAAAQA